MKVEKKSEVIELHRKHSEKGVTTVKNEDGSITFFVNGIKSFKTHNELCSLYDFKTSLEMLMQRMFLKKLEKLEYNIRFLSYSIREFIISSYRTVWCKNSMILMGVIMGYYLTSAPTKIHKIHGLNYDFSNIKSIDVKL